MKKEQEQAFMVLCKFDIKNASSTAYQECSTLEDAYKFITKLGVQLYNARNSQSESEIIEFKNVVSILKTIPFLKVYQHDPNDHMNYLKATVDFSKGYKAYVSKMSKESTKVYEELVRASETDQEFIKSEIENAVNLMNSKESD